MPGVYEHLPQFWGSCCRRSEEFPQREYRHVFRRGDVASMGDFECRDIKSRAMSLDIMHATVPVGTFSPHAGLPQREHHFTLAPLFVPLEKPDGPILPLPSTKSTVENLAWAWKKGLSSKSTPSGFEDPASSLA